MTLEQLQELGLVVLTNDVWTVTEAGHTLATDWKIDANNRHRLYGPGTFLPHGNPPNL
jgi:hypothetical protein